MKRKRATKVLKRVRNKSGTLQRHVNMDLEHLEHVSCSSRSMGYEAQSQKSRYMCSYKVHNSCPTISEFIKSPCFAVRGECCICASWSLGRHAASYASHVL